MPEILLDVESHPGQRKSKRLTMTSDEIAIDTDRFRWAEIDRIAYSAETIVVNGADMGALFIIRVGASARAATFALETRTSGVARINRNDEQRGRQRAQWSRAVAVLDQMAGDRITNTAVAAVRRGDVAVVDGLRLDQDGLHKDGLFGKSAAWRDIDGVQVLDQHLVVFVRRGSELKPMIKVAQRAWNVVLLPRIINALTSEPSA